MANSAAVKSAVWVVAAAVTFGLPAAAAHVRVVGPKLVNESGEALVLRGANWGWWGCVEPHDASDMKRLGATLVRIAFLHDKVTDPPDSDRIGGPGLALLDNMCSWAQEAGLWFILDYHTPPGGNNPWSWNYGGANRLWRERKLQEQWIAVWTQLVRRYRHYDRLLGYELMNEPVPEQDYPLEDYERLCLEAIDAIRAEDPDRPIVVSDPYCSSIAGLEKALLPRPSLVYTIHFYEPGILTYWQIPDGRYPGVWPLVQRWLENTPEDWGASGDTDWHVLEQTFTPPAEATHGQLILRSTRNVGTCWFDDVNLLCDGETVPISDNLDFPPNRKSEGWIVERQTAGQFAWDPHEGHSAPGSLRIQGTDSYNAWALQKKFRIKQGAQYVLRCHVKTSKATGHSYPMVAWFHYEEEQVDRAWLAARIRPAVEFRERHQVPVFCGEFGCAQPSWGDGVTWVADVANILNRFEIPWTYWNWRETTGMGSMGVWVRNAEHQYVPQQALVDALSRAWQE
ncbi:MAG: cellulase family glycosylhydrolase [Armatimonadetes bacterium]|nr:cellulase family glycosylhydrolase [Armatimonadota bacterium]